MLPENLEPDQKALLDKVITELAEGDTHLIEAMTDRERKIIYDIIGEMSDNTGSLSLDYLWELDYKVKPVDLDTFLDDKYYMGDVGRTMPDVWRQKLHEVFRPGSKVFEIIARGAIGTYKTTSCLVAILYKLYRLTCMKSPQIYFGLLPYTPIVFGLFNVTRELVRSVNYQVLHGLLKSSPYFAEVSEYDKMRDKYVLPHNIQFVFGSQSLHALGQAVFGGLMDEVNFSKSVEHKQVSDIYSATRRRLESRFMNLETGRIPGLLALISSSNTQEDWLDKHIANIKDPSTAAVISLAIWEVKPPPIGTKTFRVLVGDRVRSSRILPDEEPNPEGMQVVNAPVTYRLAFEQNTEDALRDLAGVAVYSISPLIQRRERILDCEVLDQKLLKYVRQHPFTRQEITISVDSTDEIRDYVVDSEFFQTVDVYNKIYRPKLNPGAPRYIHVDLSLTGDCAGISMVHLYGLQEVTRIEKDGLPHRVKAPIIFADFMLRIRPPSMGEIDLTKIRGFIAWLIERGFVINKVTYDGFQSAESKQILHKMNINTDTLSVDRTADPYFSVKTSVAEGRFSCYHYEPFIEEITTVQVEYLPPTLARKVPRARVFHLPHKRKDVSDSVAGATFSALADENMNTLVTVDPVGITLADQRMRREKTEYNVEAWLIGDLPGYESITGMLP